ncbi:MAG: YqjK family protein [Pseudomonadota bacterium]
MSKSLAELHQERGRLRERIAQQRATLAREVAPLARACDTIDAVRALARDTARRVNRLASEHPALVAGIAALFFALRPRRTLRWIGRGMFLWRGWRNVRRLLASVF